MQTLKVLARPVSAHEIAYELSKIPANGFRNKLGAQSVANILKRLIARGGVEVFKGHTHTYKLKDANAPFKRYSRPA
jgi:hypothetical protein